MIIDTTYLLPLARIRIKTDLLKAIAENKLKEKIDFSDLKISLISIFELQAKASKLNIPPKYVAKAINVVFKIFNVIPFYREDIIDKAHEFHNLLGDYIDSIILATAIVLREDLVTEDRLINSLKNRIEESYKIRVLSYNDLIN